jgi:transposase
VDVSGDHLDARLEPGAARLRVARDPEGVAALAAWCRQHAAGLVVMEASGGYERLAHVLLWEAGLPCAVVNPRQVRRFAEAIGILEKTDRVDARVIARYGTALGPAPKPPRADAAQRLRELVTYRRQIVSARVALLNQRRLVAEPVVLASVARRIAGLEAEIADLDAAIAAHVAADPLWAELSAAFTAVPGLAATTAAVVLAEMPEIGTLDHKAVAKLAGLAPLADDTGKRQGARRIRGGRAPIRSALVLVAGLVARHDPGFRAAGERLAARGKAKLVVRVALARKLLVQLNAKARDVRRAFNTPHQPKPA